MRMSDYERTVQAIKDLDKIPSVQEWNRIASEHDFLTTCTLRMITDMNFIKFCRAIRKKKTD